MERYFIYFAYNGSNFHGWQKQKNAHSVQAEMENALKILRSETIELTAAGRTDTGVHAHQMIAHFDSNRTLEDIDRFVYQLNNILGNEISIHGIKRVKDNAHARFDAISRTYHYYLLSKKDPFYFELAYHHFRKLDFSKMNEAAKLLLGKQDFSSFSKSNTQTKTNICTIENAQWKEIDKIWVFEIKADRFLRNMVRAIVGTLLEIGEGKRDVLEMREIIERKDRSYAGTSAPAHGLYLEHVEYPDSIFL